MTKRWALLLALGPLAAGCLSAQPEAVLGPAGVDLAGAVRALVGELPCEAEVGPETSANVAQLASQPLDRNGFVGAGELWLQGERAYVARYGTGGFSIVSLADPLHPVELGAWDPVETDRGLDVKALPDGSAVLVGGDAGIRVVDVRDPPNPVLEHEERFARPQAHMLTVFRVGGQDYVAAAKGDRQDLPIWRVAGGPGAHTLELVASPRLNTLERFTPLWGPHDLLRTHDAFFYDDPLAGPTLWVANVWDGIVALDVRDPSQPREVARIPNLKPQYTHTVQTIVLDDGGAPRRVTVSVSEIGYNTLNVFDTTELDDPRLLAEWHVGDPRKPQHNLQIVPPYLYVAHYDEGVFVFELRDLLDGGGMAPMARLAAQGGEIPRQQSPTSMAFDLLASFEGTWDVGLRDGLLYATDGALRVAAFGCVAPGEPAHTSAG